MDKIGSKIKELRVSKGYTLKDISKKTDLTVSFLSQLERSKTSVTLQSLSKISKALGVNQSYFFGPDEEVTKHIIRNKNQHDVKIHGTNFVYQSLAGNLSNQIFDPMIVVLLPDQNQNRIASMHEGQEFIYVIEGNLTVIIEESTSIIDPGDSFHIDSSTPHTWFNATCEVVKLLYVSSKTHSNFTKS